MNAIDRQHFVTGPVPVEIGKKRIVTSKHDLYPYPRQSVPIDRKLLSENGYGDAAISILESGDWIVGGMPGLAPDEGLLEFPDGARYVRRMELLPDGKMSIEIVRRLPDAVR
jgi:hypothetical protein